MQETFIGRRTKWAMARGTDPTDHPDMPDDPRDNPVDPDDFYGYRSGEIETVTPTL